MTALGYTGDWLPNGTGPWRIGNNFCPTFA